MFMSCVYKQIGLEACDFVFYFGGVEEEGRKAQEVSLHREPKWICSKTQEISILSFKKTKTKTNLHFDLGESNGVVKMVVSPTCNEISEVCFAVSTLKIFYY